MYGFYVEMSGVRSLSVEQQKIYDEMIPPANSQGRLGFVWLSYNESPSDYFRRHFKALAEAGVSVETIHAVTWQLDENIDAETLVEDAQESAV